MRTPTALLLLLLSASAAAAIDIYDFETPEQESRFQRLSEEFRCLVCQNQTLADSSSDLAQDLRREVQTMIKAGKSDAEISRFMTQRYGDFVLYRPALNVGTFLLWVGPFLLLITGVLVFVRAARHREAGHDSPGLNNAEQRQLEHILSRQERQR